MTIRAEQLLELCFILSHLTLRAAEIYSPMSNI